jgi:HNH endonuclease
MKTLPSVEYLWECFTYDRESGELRWKVRPREHFATKKAWATWNGKHAGKIAGNLHPNGYYYVSVDYGLYKAHRIIWKLVTTDEPPVTVDHINGRKADNRWCNLREATQIQQRWNSGPRKDNTSGYRGVRLQLGVWRAYIGRHHLGRFDTPKEASVAYEAAARDRHGEFYRPERELEKETKELGKKIDP